MEVDIAIFALSLNAELAVAELDDLMLALDRVLDFPLALRTLNIFNYALAVADRWRGARCLVDKGRVTAIVGRWLDEAGVVGRDGLVRGHPFAPGSVGNVATAYGDANKAGRGDVYIDEVAQRVRISGIRYGATIKVAICFVGAHRASNEVAHLDPAIVCAVKGLKAWWCLEVGRHTEWLTMG